jgi:hypothetical protein
MKYLLSLLFVSFSLMTFAQNENSAMKMKMKTKSSFTPDQEAILKTKKMALQLDLNENQQSKILAINKKMAADHKKMMENHKAMMESDKKPTSDERFKMMSDMLEVQLAQQNDMKKILNDDQYKEWRKSNKYKMHRIKEKGMMHKSHNSGNKKMMHEKQKMKSKNKS